MKPYLIAFFLISLICAIAQEPLSLQEKHNQFLGTRMSQFSKGDHYIAPLLLENCKNHQWDISIYLLEDKFSLYLEMNGITVHQQGMVSMENDQCTLATHTKIVLAPEVRGWGMASCNTCGNKDCYPCTADGPESCVVFRFRECHQEGCKKSFSDPGHLTIDHTWRKISRRSEQTSLEYTIAYIFSLNKMKMEIEGNYAQIIPTDLEKFPIALMECGAKMLLSIQKRSATYGLKPCLRDFVQAQIVKVLPLCLCEVIFQPEPEQQPSTTAGRACTFHVWDWNGSGETCKCWNCGALRDCFHNWHNCTCGRCGKVQNINHLWDWNGSGSTCKCWTCGTVRDSFHNWHNCTCGRCGKVQNINHLWDWNGSGSTCKCWTCGTVRDSFHNWVGNTCARCGKTK